MNTDIPEEREELDTLSILESEFIKELNLGPNHPAAQTPQPSAPVTALSDFPEDVNREKLLIELYEVRDDMITSFGGVNHNSAIAQSLVGQINKLGSCIQKLGGVAENFNPLDHISGLQSPNLVKNAERVIETTKQCYDASLGSVKAASVEENGQTIKIVFEGKDGDIAYRAAGTLRTVANASWAGNEAVDYIYSPGAGKMSVKSFEGNSWIDRSSDYEILWELEEENKSVEKTASEKKDVTDSLENKNSVSQEEEIQTDFPIEENSTE